MSNKSVYKRCGMRECGCGVGSSVVEWVKRSTLRWFGHIERIENEEFVKNVYLSTVEDPNMRGRALGRWEDRVKKYMSERGVRGNGLQRARIGRGGDPSAVAIPLRDTSIGSEASELLIDLKC